MHILNCRHGNTPQLCPVCAEIAVELFASPKATPTQEPVAVAEVKVAKKYREWDCSAKTDSTGYLFTEVILLDKSLPNGTKLYAHALRELSDDEMIKSAEEAGFSWTNQKGIFVRHSNGSWICIDAKLLKFGEILLKKAQEK